MRLDLASPAIRGATAALVAASLVTNVPVAPAFADIGELLPQKAKPTKAPEALESLKKDDSPNAADVTINLKKLPNIIGIATSLNPLDPISTVQKVADALPKSIGVVLPVVNLPIKVNIGITIDKTTAAEVAEADVVVDLPKDLGKAASLASAGDVSLALKGAVNGRLDVDLNTPTRGEADITVLSKLVPKLPLAKTAGTGRFCATCGNGEPISDWFVVRNVKNGVSFYTNLVTGVSQFQAPGGI